jgi:hypothetical protein
MKINYFLTIDGCQSRFRDKIYDLVKMKEVRRICDIGGGANPFLPIEIIREFDLEYTVLDISSTELDKAPSEYHKVLADISDPSFSIDNEFDLVCTQFLAEHIPSALHFHSNVFKMLSNGGYAIHYFPTLYNVPYTINKIIPEGLAERALLTFQPNRLKQGKQGKFPAYYDWCYGPTTSNIKRFTNLGYEIEEYTGFFGHGFYKAKKAFKILDILESQKTNFLLEHPNPWFTQFAHLLLKKPQ